MKNNTIENDNLQLMPRQVHSWEPCLRKCHHLSVNVAVTVVASCTLAAIYQCFSDLGFSYIPACGWVKVKATWSVRDILL